MTAGREAGVRRSARLRAAVPLAFVCLVLQLGSAAHFVLTPHSLCADHGEIVDGPGHHTAPAAVPVERAGQVSPRSDDAELAGHEHDHCLLAQHRRDGAPDARGSVGIAAAARSAETSAASRLDRAQCPIELILVAPKSSPPVLLAA